MGESIMDQAELKKKLIENLHWIALSAVIIFIAATIILGGEAKTQKTQQQIAKSLKDLQRAMENNEPKQEAIFDYINAIKYTWAMVPSAQKGPDQEYLYEKSKITYKAAVPPTHQWINSPKEIRLNVDREKITVSWDIPDAPVGQDGKPKETTEIAGYHLTKYWTNDENKKMEETISLEDTNYEDTKVEAKIDYFYKARAYTNNVEAKGGKLVTFEDKKVVVSEYTAPAKGTILPLYRIKLNGVSGDTAFIELSKWEKGDWRNITFYVKKGEKIEKNAYIKELKKTIHFNPGWTLIGITTKLPRTLKVTQKRFVIDPKTKQPIKGPDGNPVVELVEQDVNYFVAAIRYSDEKGKIEIKEQESGKKP